MKKIYLLLFSVLVASIMLVNCSHKADIQPTGELKVYNDKSMGFSMKYPSGWYYKQTSTGYVAFTKKDDMQRFFNYDTKGNPGAKVDFAYVTLDSVPAEKIIEKFKKFDPSVYQKPEPYTFDGVQGWKIKYQFELEDGIFQGEAYWATKDNKIASVLIFEAFSGTFDAYKPTFDEILKSTKLASSPDSRVDTVNKLVEQEPPSQTLKYMEGTGYGISIPENFEREKGGIYVGKRRGDCYVKVDVIDASSQTNVEKIANDSKGNFPGATDTKSISLGGQKAVRIFYQPSKQVKGEVTFVVKDKKLYRITINWFTGEESSYKAILQKCVDTFKFI